MIYWIAGVVALIVVAKLAVGALKRADLEGNRDESLRDVGVADVLARGRARNGQRESGGDTTPTTTDNDTPEQPKPEIPAPTLVIHTQPLRGIPEIRHFFRTNETPVYFVSATAFNLLGIDRWVRNFRFINYYDSFDGWHPNVFVPKEQTPRAFESIEEICNYLLGHKEVIEYIAERGPGGKVAFLMFDEETEGLAKDLELDVAFPAAALRHRMDSKIVTTELGNEAGVPSVANTMGRASSYRAALDLANRAGLGDDLVIQTPYGDSGHTTFFIADEDDWKEHASEIVGEDLKIMRRIEPRECAIEGVITRHGTLVGPLMAELTGFPELTPYDGGWCGNDVSPDVLTEKQRKLARERTFAMGERLRQEGYRGYFELDFLADATSGEMFLGELNPRVTGASSITNVTAVAYGDMPLFLFHLLEFMDVDYEIDVDELNDRWAQAGNVDEWTQFILKQTDEAVELITHAPASGIWRIGDDAQIAFARRDTDWHTVRDETEAFYLRIAGVGQYRYPGADLGILVTRGRFMDQEHELLDRARHWITGVKAQFAPPATGGGVSARPSGALRVQDPLMEMVPFTFRSLEELELGPKWQGMFEERWPHYRAWFLREGEGARPTYATGVRMLNTHMPELMPAYERLVDLAGGGDLAARMLSLYKPPPYLAACSQGAWTREGGPMLVRNYDYAPSRFEGTIWSTRLTERRVIGMSDCLWGLLDGMNDSGLAVSLTFGGRRVLGDGFGIPIVVRYLLETCDDVAGARAALARLPYSLSHNLTIVDRAGAILTAYLSPDREPIFSEFPAATNHQGLVEWPEQAKATRTIERERCIIDLLNDPELPAEGFVDSFLRAPLFSTAYASGFGTLYTASYRAAQGVAEYRWLEHSWWLGFDDFVEAEHTEVLAEGSVA